MVNLNLIFINELVFEWMKLREKDIDKQNVIIQFFLKLLLHLNQLNAVLVQIELPI